MLMLAVVAVAGCAHSNVAPAREEFPVYSPPPDSLVLRVRVLDVQFTDWHPACEDPENCMPMSFWHRYRAQVISVASGSWSDSEVEFVHLQHAQYIQRVTRDCYVVLLPAGPRLKSQLEVEFVADRILSRFFEDDRPAIRALQDGS